MRYPTKASDTSVTEKQLKALCALSDFPTELDLERLLVLICQAPDPETASRQVVANIAGQSDSLSRKWRQVVINIWSAHHPHVPLLASLPLTADDVANVLALRDAHAFLQAVDTQPAELAVEGKQHALHPHDILRLAKVLPSLENTPLIAFESEWSCLPVRRLKAVLQALRLIRVYQGRLITVRSRYQRFLQLPPLQQFYILWHADAYHVDWSEFAGQWHRYLHVLQDYLPLLWDLNQDAAQEAREESHAWCADIMKVFLPIWEQEGLFTVNTGHEVLMSIFQQCLLPSVLEKVLVFDLLAHYSLITMRDSDYPVSFNSHEHPPAVSNEFTWTGVGEVLIRAERSSELPCSLTLLEK